MLDKLPIEILFKIIEFLVFKNREKQINYIEALPLRASFWKANLLVGKVVSSSINLFHSLFDFKIPEKSPWIFSSWLEIYKDLWDAENFYSDYIKVFEKNINLSLLIPDKNTKLVLYGNSGGKNKRDLEFIWKYGMDRILYRYYSGLRSIRELFHDIRLEMVYIKKINLGEKTLLGKKVWEKRFCLNQDSI